MRDLERRQTSLPTKEDQGNFGGKPLHPETMQRVRDFMGTRSDDYFTRIPEHIKEFVVRAASFIIDLPPDELLATASMIDARAEEDPVISKYNERGGLIDIFNQSKKMWGEIQERLNDDSEFKKFPYYTPSSTTLFDPEALGIKVLKIHMGIRIITAKLADEFEMGPEIMRAPSYITSGARITGPIDATEQAIAKILEENMRQEQRAVNKQ